MGTRNDSSKGPAGPPPATRRPIPLIVLAGSDPHPVILPESGAGLHPLKGPKGIQLKIGGRPLIDLLIERLEVSGHFAPIFIAGPASVYGESRGRVTVIDTHGSFGRNVENAVEAVARVCPSRPVALTTCDILPEVEELHSLMEDYYQHAPLDFWFPAILAPEREQELGASAWKPRYRVAPAPGREPETLLPGHLLVADPACVRRSLIYRCFTLAYATRNRSILYRLGLLTSRLIPWLLWEDVKLLVRGRLPAVTVTVLLNGVLFAFHLRGGTVTPDEVAERLRRIFVSFRHRRRFPDRRGRIPLLHGLSLAKDLDTEEEVREIVRELRREGGGAG